MRVKVKNVCVCAYVCKVKARIPVLQTASHTDGHQETLLQVAKVQLNAVCTQYCIKADTYCSNCKAMCDYTAACLGHANAVKFKYHPPQPER